MKKCVVCGCVLNSANKGPTCLRHQRSETNVYVVITNDKNFDHAQLMLSIDDVNDFKRTMDAHVSIESVTIPIRHLKLLQDACRWIRRREGGDEAKVADFLGFIANFARAYAGEIPEA